MGNATEKNMTGRSRMIRFLGPGFILGLWMLFSLPYFAKGLVPFPSKYLVTFFPPWNASYGMPVKNNAMPDVISQIYPWKIVTISSWKSGQVPLWNPYSFSGTVHAGNYQTAVFSPINLLYIFLPFLSAWSMSILLQPLLAGMFMYLLIRSYRLDEFSAVISAVSFMFCGFIITWMEYGTLGYAILFLPLALYAVKREFDMHHWSNGILLSLAVACSFLSGHFQISLYMALVIAVYIYFSARQNHRWKVGLHLIGFFAIGLALPAPQLLLAYKSFAESTREIFIQSREVIPWQYLVTFLAPDFFGNPVTRNDWFGHYAEWSGFAGIIPLILAVFALAKPKDKNRLFFIVLLFTGIFLAYPTFMSGALFRFKIPVISTSAASRVIVLTSFSIAVLAGFGLSDIMSVWQKKQKRLIFVLSLIFIIVVTCLWASLFLFKILPPENLLIVKRNILLPTALIASAIGISVTGLVWSDKKVHLILAAALLLLTAFDGYRFASKWIPFEPKEYIYPPAKVLTYIAQTAGINRVFGGIGSEVGSVFSVPLIEGYDAVYKRRYGQFIASSSDGILKDAERSVVLFDKHGLYRDAVIELLGVRYVLHRLSDGRNIWAFPYWEYPSDQMKSLYRDEHYELFEYTKAFPRVFLASSYRIEKDDQKILDAVFDRTLDRKNTLILEEEPAFPPQEGAGKTEIVSYSANAVTVLTEAGVNKLLFLSDAYDDGWKVFIDGKPGKIQRADYAFRAVAVPKGTHRVLFRYEPIQFTSGVLITGIGVILLIGYAVYSCKKRK